MAGWDHFWVSLLRCNIHIVWINLFTTNHKRCIENVNWSMQEHDISTQDWVGPSLIGFSTRYVTVCLHIDQRKVFFKCNVAYNRGVLQDSLDETYFDADGIMPFGLRKLTYLCHELRFSVCMKGNGEVAHWVTNVSLGALIIIIINYYYYYWLITFFLYIIYLRVGGIWLALI